MTLRTCTKCQITQPLHLFNNGKISWCLECRNKEQRRRRTVPLIRANALYRSAKLRSINSKLEFSLTLSYIEYLILCGKCQRTGIKFDLAQPPNGMKYNPFAPSIDKIDPNGGYTDQNIQMVCWAYNIGKSQMTVENYENFILIAAEFIRRKQ